MAAVEEVALKDVFGKKSELTNCAPALALEPGLGQSRFLTSNLGDFRSAAIDRIGDGIQERRTGLAAQVAKGPECFLGSSAGAVHQLRRANREGVGRS
jgi:hypothetical protein